MCTQHREHWNSSFPLCAVAATLLLGRGRMRLPRSWPSCWVQSYPASLGSGKMQGVSWKSLIRASTCSNHCPLWREPRWAGVSAEAQRLVDGSCIIPAVGMSGVTSSQHKQLQVSAAHFDYGVQKESSKQPCRCVSFNVAVACAVLLAPWLQ